MEQELKPKLTPAQKRDAQDVNSGRQLEHALLIFKQLIESAERAGLHVEFKLSNEWARTHYKLKVYRDFRNERRLVHEADYSTKDRESDKIKT